MSADVSSTPLKLFTPRLVPVTTINSSSNSVPLCSRTDSTIESPLTPVQSSARLLYEGSKAFWRFRCTLDLFIVKHTSESPSPSTKTKTPEVDDDQEYTGDVIEVIGYNPTTDQETSRLYLRCDVILASFAPKELQTQIEKRKEVAMRNNRSFHLTGIQQEVEDQNYVNYVLARVIILQIQSEDNETEKSSSRIMIGLNPGYSDPIDTSTGQLLVLTKKSPVPFEIPRKKTVP